MASEELERIAVQSAGEAIQCERSGSRTLATSKYERAIEVLLKLCSLYPDAPQNGVYINQIERYKTRVRELRTNSPSGLHSTPGQATSSSNHTSRLILSQKPNVRWDDIGDLYEAKNAIEDSVIFPVKRPDLFPLGWPRGILFFGPPGCGKTLLAAAVANEINATFFSVDASSIMSKWLGESERNVARLFEDARAAAGNGNPAIIFIDEIDSMVGIRRDEVGGEVRTRNQFLKEMDGLLEKVNPKKVYVIGATNKPWALDEPFIRRFQKRIYVTLPNLEGRGEILKKLSSQLSFQDDVDFDEFLRMTSGYSGSDIHDILQSAQIKVVREYFESNGENGRVRRIGMADLKVIIQSRKPSVSNETLVLYERWFERFKAS